MIKKILENKVLTTLVATHLIFFIVKSLIGNYFLTDSIEYVRLSQNIWNSFIFSSGDLNAINEFELTKRPPLYAIFIILSSLGTFNIYLTVFVQNIISISSIYISLSLFQKLGTRVNNKVIIVFIISGISQFVYANLLMSEMFLQFLIVLLCYALFNFLKSRSWKLLLVFQFLVILLFLTKPVFYLIVIPNFVLAIFLSKKLKYAWTTSLIPLLILFLYCQWNYTRTGSYDFSSIQNINLIDYNLKLFHINKYGEEYALKINEEIKNKADRETNYVNKQRVLREEGYRYLKNDLWSYSWFHFKGSLRMIFDPGRFDLSVFFDEKSNEEVGFSRLLNLKNTDEIYNFIMKQSMVVLILLPIILFFNIIKAIGFVKYWVFNFRKVSLVHWVMLFLILYIIALTGPVGASRFLVPILPFITIFAAAGWSRQAIKT